MALKSYRVKFKAKGSKPKRRRSSGALEMVRHGTTAIIGIGFLGATIGAVNRI